MYNLIDQGKYSKYNQELMVRIAELFKERPVFWGHVIYTEMLMDINDYALFLSFYDKYGQTGNVRQVVHLGENCLYRMTCIWEHLGYFLNQYFHRYTFYYVGNQQVFIKGRDVVFDKVINSLVDNAASIDNTIYELFVVLKKLYDRRNSSRSIRNIATHRYHTGTWSETRKGNINQASIVTSNMLQAHVDKIKKELSDDFNTIFEAIDIFLNLEKWYFDQIPTDYRK